MSKLQHNINATSTKQLGFTWKGLYTTNTQTHSMSAISQLLLTQFWPNFKGRLKWEHLEQISPGTFVLINICPYQEYLSCYWPSFDQNLKIGLLDHSYQMPTITVIFVQATYVLITFVHISITSAVIGPILTNIFEANFWEPTTAIPPTTTIIGEDTIQINLEKHIFD